MRSLIAKYLMGTSTYYYGVVDESRSVLWRVCSESPKLRLESLLQQIFSKSINKR